MTSAISEPITRLPYRFLTGPDEAESHETRFEPGEKLANSAGSRVNYRTVHVYNDPNRPESKHNMKRNMTQIVVLDRDQDR